MKRIHIHINVTTLESSIQFYNTLFGQEATVIKEDYAKWALDDPKVNFAISLDGDAGVQHLGIEAESKSELDQLYQRRDLLEQSDAEILDQGETVCCYAQSKKSWVTDPQNISWELFHTTGESEQFSENAAVNNSSSCCTPSTGCCSS